MMNWKKEAPKKIAHLTLTLAKFTKKSLKIRKEGIRDKKLNEISHLHLNDGPSRNIWMKILIQ